MHHVFNFDHIWWGNLCVGQSPAVVNHCEKQYLSQRQWKQLTDRRGWKAWLARALEKSWVDSWCGWALAPGR